MNKNAKIRIIALLSILYFMFPFPISNSSAASMRGGIERFKTFEDILEKRKRYFTPTSNFTPDRMVKILIVPGHDDQYSGSVFNQTKEVELNRIVAQKLFNYLNKEPGIEVTIAHEDNKYNPFLEFIFSAYKNDIANFMKQTEKDFSKKIKKEKIELEDLGYHNTAVPDVRHRLYGINWWANHDEVDLVIHIHFNDYANRKAKEKKYDGFAMYIPGEHFRNHEISKLAAQSIFDELKKIRPISNLPHEEKGIIEGHELIAVGANESLFAGSVLIEYGYIYEDMFQDVSNRDVAFDYFAYSTYLGVKDFLNENYLTKEKPITKITKNKTTKDNLVWQFEKALEGTYPPKGKTLRDCPITGYFGECSQAVK